MKSLPFPALALAGCLATAVMLAADAPPAKTHKMTTVSPRKLADSLHAVIATDQVAYVRAMAERAAGAGGSVTNLPDHAQMLRAAATSIQQKGAEFSYTLRSLWPINASQGPQTEVEQAGMAFVSKHPGTNYYTEEMLGGRSYFTAIYPDVAALPSCVECHNKHPGSLRRDFKLNEVMGAIVVRVPLEF